MMVLTIVYIVHSTTTCCRV